MVDILHRIASTTSPGEIYAALTTIDGLAAWWTEDTKGDPAVGGVIHFQFEQGFFDMAVRDLRPAELVAWEVVAGPEEWIGTQVRFELTQDDGWTVILFQHAGWREPVEFMNHCSTKWAIFLMSLKKLVETGTGDPAPRDVQISNWH